MWRGSVNRLQRRRGRIWYEYTSDFEREMHDGWILVDILDYMEYA